MDESADVEFPDWARALLEKTAARSVKPPTVHDHRGRASWSLLVDAATVSTFLPRELDPRTASSPERKDAERSVLEFAEPTQDADGARWTLTREARRAVLSACEPGDIDAAVDRTSLQFHDPLTVALRDTLRGTHVSDYDSLTAEQLSARRLVATWVRDVEHVHAPSLEELDRQIELRRLLAPFERMIGKLTEGRGDRFFGRVKEIEDLRAYVGVVAADTFGQSVKRAVKNVARFVWTGRQPKTVWGTGGVGKTTLIAKFMLEHARAADSKFPFAYLDFDRSTITARNRAGLLAEICRQVGAQFLELTAPMTALRNELAEAARKIELSPEADSISLLAPFAMRFREAIDTAVDSSQPFLLVFDTFEIVQYGPDQVTGLEDLVRMFSGSDKIWPRLRLIISGRRKVTHFLGGAEELELGALDLKGSAEMLRAFAGDAGKSVSVAESERLVAAIAKAVGDKSNTGVRPLRLRLVCELFRDNTSTGPEVVQSLLAELKKPPAEQELGQLFVDGILVRRILGHVKDSRVRALADPGLVVRRITKDVIREVMTRGTQKPIGTGSGDGTLPDVDPIEPWVVDDAEAQSIYEAFRSEVSLVDADGDALRHRQDVRQEMLLLIRRHRPKGFRRIQELAFEHFRRLSAENRSDAASAEEAVYHGLWLDKPLDELDVMLPGPSVRLRIDPDEFEKGSPRNIYLRAKNNERLAAEEIARLPHSVALDWLAGQTEMLLTQTRLVEEIPILRAVAGANYENLDERPDVAAPVARLLYRAGEWRDAITLLERHLKREKSGRDEASVSMLRMWATIAAKSGMQTDRWGWVMLSLGGVRDPLVQTEVLAHAVLGMTVPLETTMLPLMHKQLEMSARRVRPGVWRRELRILRLAISAAPREGMSDLLRQFVEVTDQLPHDRDVARLLGELRGTATSLTQVDDVWRKEKHSLLERALSDESFAGKLRQLAAVDHGDWFLPFGNALTRELKDPTTGPYMRSLIKGDSDTTAAIAKGDGHLLVQVLLASGLLMDFAALIAAAPEENAAPDAAPQLAAALVRWHHRTLA